MRILKRHVVSGILVFLPILGGVALAFSTRWGVGLSPDSAVYIGAARNLLNGNGLSLLSGFWELAPMTQYPPLFPSLLAGIGLVGVEPTVGARWLHVLLFAANIFWWAF